MRLLEFHGYGIRGYQEHHIQFRDEMTFLIGINGSGKTTVLNLIQGLLRPSYRILDRIEFQSVDVSFYSENEGSRVVRVSCSKDKDSINYSLAIDEELLCATSIPRLKENDDDNENRSFAELYELKCEEFEGSEVCRMVAQYQAPMFLTLDRIPQNIESKYRRTRRALQDPRMGRTRGNVDTCLVAIQEAISSKNSINSTLQSQYILDFRNSIVKTSLSFMADDVSPRGRINLNRITSVDIEERKREFQNALSGLNIPELKDIANDFFEKLTEASNILKASKGNSRSTFTDKESKAISTWIYSQRQLDRMDEIIGHWHTYQENVSKLQEPMNRFEECVNMFFSETGKRFYIDARGRMKVAFQSPYSEVPDNSIMEMSSGEKQIVAMLGSLIFLHDVTDPEYVFVDEPEASLHMSLHDIYGRGIRHNPDVYFIDEPEISLHLSWQDIFVDALLKACPKYQFVLATHSPNIISRRERRNWCEDLSPKFLKDGAR